MKKTCRGCHFLAKEYREEGTDRLLSFSLDAAARNGMKSDPANAVKQYFSLKCHFGVWDEGVAGSVQERDKVVNQMDRSNACFYFPYRTGMLFSAAETMQRRDAENTQLKRSHFYTRLGLWIAAGALLVNAVIAVIRHV